MKNLAQNPSSVRCGISRDGRLAAWGLLALIVLLIVVPYWPGTMTPDSIGLIESTSNGQINDWHAWAALVIWRPFYQLGFGPGLFVTLTTAVITAGSYLVLRGVFARLPAAVWTAVVLLNPVSYGPLSTLGRDNWFLAGILLAAGALQRLSAGDVSRRDLWRVVLLASLVWATMARQNAIFAVVPLAATFCWTELSRRPRFVGWRSRERALRGALGAVLCGLLLAAGISLSLSLLKSALQIEQRHPEIATYVYDIKAISQLTGEIEFNERVLPHRDQGYIDSFTPYGGSAIMELPLDHAEIPGGLAANWRQVLRDHPLQWLHVRTRALLYQLAVLGKPRWVYERVVPENALGVAYAHPRLQKLADGYTSSMSDLDNNGTLLHRSWLYLLALLPALLVIARTRLLLTPRRIAYLGSGLAVLTLQVGLFLAAPSVDMRYERMARTLSMLLVIVAFALWHRSKWVRRPAENNSAQVLPKT